ncbi:ribokinase [Maribius pontilimi]|uniref:Ribokinase n=1 Tax=Palleronia pontilimi TaxID=1964209 RepID=A0A934IJR5_9RHOB|nr:ribokinase [Palleronia pontilimi]MBJ3764262.1 ribokinase [Palleronia pontilimi]
MSIVILGVFAADCAFRGQRLPSMGETVLGEGFALGPGGKGSNQAVAASRAGGDVHFVTRLGRDIFADMARDVWGQAGVTPHVTEDADSYTGAAFIYVNADSGDNAIIVAPGAGGQLSPADIDAHAALIGGAAVFVTQLEQPMEAAHRALQLARDGGARTILNPAPAAEIPDAMLALCDVITPNESEAEILTGIAVASVDDAKRAADALLDRGVGAAIITLGENGALYRDRDTTLHVAAIRAGAVVETTGAGDAFNGGFAAALARGDSPADAVRFGNATAALSVTRAGAAASMPDGHEIVALLSRQG